MWYELYHDIFSKIIYEWNEDYKASQRKKKGVIAGVITLLACLLLYLEYDAVSNYTNHYIKLSAKTGNSDRIEINRGKAGDAGFFRSAKI